MKRLYNTGSSRTPSRLAHQARPIRQCWADLTLSRLLPPSPASPGSGCRQLHRPATTGQPRSPSTSARNNSASWRTAVFTNSPLPMLAAEKAHRAHAIVEQVIADLKNGPLAHLPSGHFWANSAWLVCATIAFNLTRTAGALASIFHRGPRPARSARNSSPSRAGSPAPPDGSPCTYRPVGRGRPRGNSSRPQRTAHRSRPDPARPVQQDLPEDHRGAAGAPARPSHHAHTPTGAKITRPAPSSEARRWIRA